jgi:glycosyltransferase involved in cell wall biosynthesis
MKTCFITCHYPPLARTYRRYKFARLLADGGLDVEVVTHGNVSRALGAFVDDADLQGDDADLPVHRVRAFPWHLAGELLHRAGAVPCPHVNWLRAAAHRAGKVAATPEDTIVSVYPPLTDHIAGYMAARRTGARLVLDYRDDHLGLKSALQKPLAAFWERRALECAELVSVATEEIGHSLSATYGVPAGKLHVTANGYWDEVDESGLSFRDQEDVHFVYAGAISPAQGLELLCAATGQLRKHHPQLRDRVRVTVYGPENFYMKRTLSQRMTEGGVEYGGLLNSEQVPVALQQADVGFLSLVSGKFSYAVPGKLYEYIAHARPVVAALPDGAASRLIEREGFGLVAGPTSVDDLVDKMVLMVDGDRRRSFHDRLLDRRNQFAAAPQFLSLAHRIQAL